MIADELLRTGYCGWIVADGFVADELLRTGYCGWIVADCCGLITTDGLLRIDYRGGVADGLPLTGCS
jgi:hypothetical protein